MRRMVVAALVCAGAASGVLATTSGGQSPRATTLSLTAETTAFSVVDTGPTGDSPGDLIVSTDRLLRDGRVVGRSSLTCIGVTGSLANGSAQCTGTFVVPGGRLEVQGEAVARGGTFSGRGAVVGGTGRYLGVRGGWVIPRATVERGTIRFRLLRD